MLNRKNYYKLVGAKLRKFRESAKLETTDLADLIEIPVESYVEYELGYPIPLVYLAKVSYMYDIPIERFMPSMLECNVWWAFSPTEAIQGKHRYTRINGKVVISSSYESSPVPKLPKLVISTVAGIN